MHDAWVFPEFSTIITLRTRASLTKDAANVVSDVLEVKQSATFPAIEVSFSDIDRQLLTLLTCGSSRYAKLAKPVWFPIDIA